jgi:hypothetical protein
MVLIPQSVFEDLLGDVWLREADENEKLEFWSVVCLLNEHNVRFQAASLGHLMVDENCQPYRLVVIDRSAPGEILAVAEYFVRMKSLEIADTVAA